MARSSMESINEWMDNTLNPDLFISTSETLSSRDFHLPASMQAELEAIPGIAEIQNVRTVRVSFLGSPIMVIAVDLEKVDKRVKRHVIAGDDRTMYHVAARGEGFIVAENLAILHHLKLGDIIEIPAPAGSLRLPIAGIVRDMSNQLGAVFIDRSTYIRYFLDDSVDVFRIYLKPGFQPESVRTDIVNRLGATHRVFVLLNRDVRQYVDKVMNQWFGMTYVQLIVAVLVAVLGIVNTLIVSITDRRRELGVLRAVGGLRAQIRGTIWMEALAVGAIGVILGVFIGAVNLYYEMEAIGKDLAGIPMSYNLPVTVTLAIVPIILGAAFAAAIFPAETAVRTSLVEALEYE
jgi:putative ABC transport system permease protein